MKFILLINLYLILTIQVNAQIKFEQGYYIDNQGKRFNCWIKNMDWKNNPTHFDYKLDNEQQIKIQNIDNIKEFGIGQKVKYVRYTVDIDRSSNLTTQMDNKRNPEFTSNTLLLKVLIEGSADLFYYEEINLIRFFYRLNQDLPQQLVYKRYLKTNKDDIITPDKDRIKTNRYYQQQITLSMNCGDNSIRNMASKAKYVESDLAKIFTQYNQCKGTQITNYLNKNTKGKFGLNIRPGLNYSSLEVASNLLSTFEPNFEKQINYRLGIEGEYFLPFNKSRWSLIIEPTYQYFSSKSNIRVSTREFFEVEYQSIEIPIGLRFFLSIGNATKVFINPVFIFDLKMDSFFNYDGRENFDIRQTNTTIGIGGGIKLLNKFSLEARIRSSRELLGELGLLSADYNTISLIVGYSLF